MNLPNADPRFDGDVTSYLDNREPNPAAARPDCFDRQIIYVNGMQYPARNHSGDSLVLSKIIEGFVVGVYNQMGDAGTTSINGFIGALRRSPLFRDSIQFDLPGNNPVSNFVGGLASRIATAAATATASVVVKDAIIAAIQIIAAGQGFVSDVVQCVADWSAILFQRLAALDFDLKVNGVILPDPVKDNLRQIIRNNMRTLVEICFSYNRAIVELFKFLDDNIGSWPMSKLFIVCHSQGNLVVCNALYALLARRVSLPRQIKIFGLASPTAFWPSSVQVRTYTDLKDLVPLFSLGRSYFGELRLRGLNNGNQVYMSKGEFSPVAHQFETYIRESEFVHDLRQDVGLASIPGWFAPKVVMERKDISWKR